MQKNRPRESTFQQIFHGTEQCALLPHMVKLLSSYLSQRIVQQSTLHQIHWTHLVGYFCEIRKKIELITINIFVIYFYYIGDLFYFTLLLISSVNFMKFSLVNLITEKNIHLWKKKNKSKRKWYLNSDMKNFVGSHSNI